MPPKKPFGEDDDDYDDRIAAKPKVSLKNVGSQQSIFDKIPKKPTQEDLEDNVRKLTDQNSSYKERAAELALQFKKMVVDKTLEQNKNIFTKEMEREVLSKMIQLAMEINVDPIEKEGMGSLTWITLLFTTCLSQRDRINKLEYSLSLLDKKIDSMGLDKKKNSE